MGFGSTDSFQIEDPNLTLIPFPETNCKSTWKWAFCPKRKPVIFPSHPFSGAICMFVSGRVSTSITNSITSQRQPIHVLARWRNPNLGCIRNPFFDVAAIHLSCRVWQLMGPWNPGKLTHQLRLISWSVYPPGSLWNKRIQGCGPMLLPAAWCSVVNLRKQTWNSRDLPSLKLT